MLSRLALALSLSSLFSFSHAKPISAEAANAGAESVSASTQGKLSTEGVSTYDGIALAAIPAAPSAAQVIAAAISQAGWTVVVDSENDGSLGPAAVDNNTSTFWHTEYQPTLAQLPHQITIDTQASNLVGSISYLPRQDGNANGNIGQHVISLSNDGTTYTTVAYGAWQDDASIKTTTFTPFTARYVRIQALSEAGNRGPWTSAAEINVYTAAAAAPATSAGKGQWVTTVDFPLIPVSLAHQVGPLFGSLLAWSSYTPSTFGGSPGTTTYTATFNPTTQSVTQAIITNTNHDMFCEGLSLDFNGRIVAAGGNTDAATSSYDPASNGWTAKARMNIPRGYQSQATTSNGNLFTIGASWSGGEGGKNGEIYNPTADTWTQLGGCPVAPLLTADAQGVYRADNHAWLFGWSNGYVFQGGPSKAMNWYLTTGTGGQTGVGNRAADTDSMCGNAVMYDAVAGKILTLGGSPDYQNSQATGNAHIITIGSPPATPTVHQIGSMAYQRAFANSVVLPDGTVFVVGGQVSPVPFSDDTSQFTPELFNPASETFTQMAPISIPRNYHSTALLMTDGTVANAGSGLCGTCATNHFDMQIWLPPYLFTGSGALATRPVINSISTATVGVGQTFSITTNAACDSFSMIRMSSTTHTVNTDQRRIALTPSGTAGTTYTFTVPTDAGVALPGYYMVFAMAGGVPTVSQQLQVTL